MNVKTWCCEGLRSSQPPALLQVCVFSSRAKDPSKGLVLKPDKHTHTHTQTHNISKASLTTFPTSFLGNVHSDSSVSFYSLTTPLICWLTWGLSNNACQPGSGSTNQLLAPSAYRNCIHGSGHYGSLSVCTSSHQSRNGFTCSRLKGDRGGIRR